MCGIFGTVGFKGNLLASLNRMVHRGPDDWGEYLDQGQSVYLGHRRLAIIDLSDAGRQPMALADEDLYITYNGEIYNFQLLKKRYFGGTQFFSQTDTEVILHLYKRFRYRTPEYMRGMFAFGIYDRNNKEIFLCRDRLGIKPLYYYNYDGKFAFSSELSALKRLPGINLEKDPVGLDHYFTYGFIPAPFSAYKHINKVRAAHMLIYDIDKQEIRVNEPFWQLKDVIQPDLYSSEPDWLAAIEEKIREAVKLRLISDVPLGAFLSGGLDSSLIVSEMAGLVSQPVKTFTIGFESVSYDERAYAESVAGRYETDHTVEMVRPEAVEVLPKLIEAFGEPFSDPSAIPTYYVSEMARRHVTVALSGDGGDEVFAGYNVYRRMHRHAFLSHIPFSICKFVQYLGKYFPKHLTGYGFMQRIGYSGIPLFHEMQSWFPLHERTQLYTEEFQHLIAKNERNLYDQIIDENPWVTDDFITAFQVIDLYSYLPENILTKVDRMSMLFSLETRVPLLDHELVGLVFSCPSSIRFKKAQLKYITKRILRGKVSKEVLHHNKQGFRPPISEWLKKEWKPLMRSLLNHDNSDSFINTDYARQIFELHQKGRRDFSEYLYALLFYMLWQSQGH